jgi:hypothetical protein
MGNKPVNGVCVLGARLGGHDVEETGMDDCASRRARLAEIERRLAGLQGQHDLAMSAFKFDEADALQRRIGALDDERRAIVPTLPRQVLPPAPDTGVVPIPVRPRRLRRRR